MLLFYSIFFPAQFLTPTKFERSKNIHESRDVVEREVKERLISVLLLLCILAAGLYDEILRYGF